MSADAQLSLGWTGRIMQVLDAAWTLVLVNLLFLGGVLAGLVVLGIMPASTAAASVLLRDAQGVERAGGAIRLFIREYRRSFSRANLTGLAFLVTAILLAADSIILPGLTGPVAAVLTALTTVVALVALLAWVVVVTLLVRYGDGPTAILRYAVTVALASPATSGGVLVVLVSFGMIAVVLPVVVPLVGLSLPLAIMARLMDRRLAGLDPQHPLASPHQAAHAA